eukprot:1463461-Pyramimonas_sp.AAC.1
MPNQCHCNANGGGLSLEASQYQARLFHWNPSVWEATRTRQRNVNAILTQCQATVKAIPIQCQWNANGGSRLWSVSGRILLWKVLYGILP